MFRSARTLAALCYSADFLHVFMLVLVLHVGEYFFILGLQQVSGLAEF